MSSMGEIENIAGWRFEFNRSDSQELEQIKHFLWLVPWVLQ